MVLVTRKHLEEAATRHKYAASAIEAWVMIVKDAHWTSFVELRKTFPDADMVDGYVIFNIRGNRYRLVTVVHFSKKEADGQKQTKGHVYIRSFLTHKEYDTRENWDRRFSTRLSEKGS